MGATILEAINELTAAIGALQQQMTITNHIDVSPICCEDAPDYYDVDITTIQVGVGDPPDPYPDWPTYLDDLCERAFTAVRRVEKAMNQIYDIAAIGTATITLGALLAILALVLAPWAVAAAILAMLTTGSFEISIVLLRGYLNDLESELVCAIYNSETATDALVAIEAVLDASQLDVLSIQILKKTWSNGLLNSIFDQTLTIDPGVPSDCSFCDDEELQGDCWLFDSGLGDWEMSNPPPATVEFWPGEGHLAPGSCRLGIPSGTQDAGITKHEWDGRIVATNDRVEAWFDLTQATTQVNIIIVLSFTDASSQIESMVIGPAPTPWTKVTLTVQPGHNGKTIDAIKCRFSAGLNSEQKYCLVDEICFIDIG
jgi:hypothetical protein